MSKAIEREVIGPAQATSGIVHHGCLECGADVRYERTAPLGVEVPIGCPACGFELALRRLDPNRAAVRRPYGCRRWVHLDSANLAAAGTLDRDLLVRFRSGGVYRYAGGAEVFPDLIAADSAGRFLHRKVKSRFPATRTCARYGCTRPAKRGTNQVLCRECLDRAPAHPG